MIAAVLRRPVGKSALLIASLFLVLVGAGSGVTLLLPRLDANLLVIPLLAVACALAAAHLRIDNAVWRLEAPFVAATAVALGPWWALGTAAICHLANNFLKIGRFDRDGGMASWAPLVFTCSAVALANQFVVLPGEISAVLLVLAWRGMQFWMERSRYSSPAPILISIALAAPLGGLIEAGAEHWVPTGLIPIAFIASIALFEARSSAGRREALQTLALMLQRAHPYTHAHIERVASIAERTAKKLGLSGDRSRMIREAARLHDIGKVAIDELILDKPGSLSRDEYDHVKLHAPFGAAILEEIDELRSIADWIRFHHERPDGLGYPRGLSGDQIPLEARIIAVADAFDAMTGGFEGGERRPYREPISSSEALVEMERYAGTQFDARVVAAFREALEEEVSL